MPKARVMLPTLAVLSALVVSGCVMVPYSPRSANAYPAPDDVEATAEAPPPPPQVEVIPVVPFAGAIWLGGYWGWRGGRHHWVQGRWERPRAGFIWSPHRWAPLNGRWHLRGGGWIRG